MTAAQTEAESLRLSDGNRLHVAMLTSVGDRCGIAAYTRALVEGMREFADVTVEPINEGRQPLEHYTAQAERLNRADVIHIQHEHSFWGGILPNRSAFWNLRYLLRKPVVLTAHTTTALRDLLKVDSERRLFHRIAKELLVRRHCYRESVETAPFITGRCIVHTREGGEALVARGANGKFIHVIPAGVPDTVAAPTNGQRFRAIAGAGNQIITLFGYVAPNKGYELAFEALKSLSGNVHLLIAGGARNDQMIPYEQRVQGLILMHGIENRVHITGHLTEEEIADAMAASDIVIAPHTQATGSYSIMVPLSYGKAIVASDLACFHEIQEQVPCMELFRTGDAADFARVVADVLREESQRVIKEQLAADYARTHSWREVARKTVEVYREAIADVARLAHHSALAGEGLTA